MTTVSLNLPFPPSTNALFFNRAGKGRVKSDRYRTWATAAGWDLKSQKPSKIAGPYELHLILERKSGRRDLGNLEKAISDLLVEHQIIEDDSLAERIILEWGAVKGCRVIVREAVSALKVAAE